MVDEKDLLAQYGQLQLERETYGARLRDIENKMNNVKQELINLKQKQVK